MKRTIHLLCGIPGCGKTTWANAHKGANGQVLSRDDVRDQIRTNYNSSEYFPLPESKEYRAWIFACASKIIAHPEAEHFYFDQTSAGEGAIIKFFKTLSEIYGNLEDFQLEIDFFEVPLQLCKDRNALRTGFKKVPEKVIDRMYNSIQNINFYQIKEKINCATLNLKVISATGLTVMTRCLK